MDATGDGRTRPTCQKKSPRPALKHGTDVVWLTDPQSGETPAGKESFTLLLNHEVDDFDHSHDGGWFVRINDTKAATINAKFVFLGAGGAGALPLLRASGIDEASSCGGGWFPASGWCVRTRPSSSQHHAKVYGKAAIGAPRCRYRTSTPVLFDGEPALLFGPYAGFTTKFLKAGSNTTCRNPVSISNLLPMMSVGINNMDLTKYLISEVMQSHEDRVATLRGYFPSCKDEDWTLAEAGQRVQVIKKDAEGRGKLEFGTELVAAKDGSLAALLGASPGASVSVQAMIEVLERCFKDKMQSEWKARLKKIIPSYGEDLKTNADLLNSIREHTLTTLKLK